MASLAELGINTGETGPDPQVFWGPDLGRRLSLIEEGLSRRELEIEKSSLTELDRDFPVISGKRFIDHLNVFSERGNARLLEIGGGKYQVAAREILDCFPGVSLYTGLETLALANDVAVKLQMSNKFMPVNGGISRLRQYFSTEKYGIIFAHRVLPFIPNPWQLIEEAYSFLSEGGLFFCDAVPVYKDVLRAITKELKSQGVNFESQYPDCRDSRLVRPDIVLAAIAVQRTKPSIVVPVKPGSDCLQDSEGNRFLTQEFYFDETKALKNE